MQLYEKYRPTDFDSFIGQDKVKQQIKHLLNRKEWDRDALWIQGPSGTGKTTLAWIIARQVADEFNISELDGEKCDVQAVRELEQTLPLISMFGAWKVVIVNEAHAMTARAVQAWLTLLERLPANRLVIFTTTEPLQEELFGNFSGPFGSRCKVYSFTNQGLAQAMAERAKAIAEAEGLDGLPIQRYVKLVQAHRNNMRDVIQDIDKGEMLQ